MTIRLQLLIGFFTLIFIFIVAFVVNQRLSNAVMTNTNYLNNSEVVMRNSNQLHKEMIEMQSGFRGFLLTSQEVFLQPYYEGLQTVPSLITEQRGLLSTAHQQQKLDSISLLHTSWVEYADSLISAKKDTLPESNARFQRMFDKKLKMEVGKKLNDQIHSAFESLDNFEYALRQKRRLALQQSIHSTRNISVGLTLASILLALACGIYVVRAITTRISHMVRLAGRISNGEFITVTDTKNDELSSLVTALNQMSGTLEKNFMELRKKNSELDQFAYVVSHDLKAPLRGIANLISWLEEDHKQDITPAVEQNLALIKGRADRLENMINGLLEYARIGKTARSLERVDVQELVKSIADMLVPAGVELTTSTPLPVILTERLPLEQVFANLISNAVKHNKSSGPKIVTGCRELDGLYEFWVSDNGPGIQKEYYDRIFVIFQTLQERDAFESTGVGLAIVKKIVEEKGGTIFVTSAPGQGTTFTFTWPKLKDPIKP